VTLELACAGVTTVAAYNVSLIEEIVARLAIQVPSVILPNLILEENVVPEFLQRDCTPQNLGDALVPLMTQSPQRHRQIDAFTRLDAIMRVDGGGRADGGADTPSRRAADIVLGLARPADQATR
jgi:lipid-A-disaccharide synthase